MASYLSIYRGSEGGAAKLALSQVSASNHPSVDRALRLLSAAWTEVTPVPLSCTSSVTHAPRFLHSGCLERKDGICYANSIDSGLSGFNCPGK